MSTAPSANPDKGSLTPPQDSEPVFAQASAVGDQAASNDSLGFKLYVEAITNFLLAPASRPPLTMSIEGTWGSGKSSFMLQLKRQIKAQSATATVIDFNAWKYEKQEELWAAFALTVSRSLRKNSPFPRRIMGDIRLSFLRMKGAREAAKLLFKLVAWLALVTALGLGINWSIRAKSADRVAASRLVVEEAIPAPKSAKDSSESHSVTQTTRPAAPGAGEQANGIQQSRFKDWLSLAIANSPWLTGLLLFLWLISKIPDSSRKSLFDIKLEEYID